MKTTNHENSFWNEEWMPIDFEGINKSEQYEISNYGKMRRYDPSKNEWKILKSSYIKGYRVFAFKAESEDKKSITKTIHKLVAEAFNYRPSEQHQFVIHLDYVKDNNNYKNLKWVSQEELYEHHRTNPNYKKGLVRNANSSETDATRLEEKSNRRNKKLFLIAKEFGITHTQLNNIRSDEKGGQIKIKAENKNTGETPSINE